MSREICGYWGTVFSKKQIAAKSGEKYLGKFGGQMDFSDIPPPTLAGMRARIQKLEDCAPGPDRLPYAAWRHGPMAAELLDEYLWWMMEGNSPMSSFNAVLGIFIPKGEEEGDQGGAVRDVQSLRPLGLKNSENKILAGAVTRPFAVKMAEVSCTLQRGFTLGRQFGTNIIELDTYARIASMSPTADSDLPAILSYDFSQAFPSVSHEWLRMVLERLSLPPPLLWFFTILYTNVQCYGVLGGQMLWLFSIWSGIIQGCPASGALFAAALNPFLLDFKAEFVDKCRGVMFACADDLGAVILNMKYLTVLYRVFRMAQLLAALILK
eukprot:1959635-Pyramimonas_sp.AAC.1